MVKFTEQLLHEHSEKVGARSVVVMFLDCGPGDQGSILRVGKNWL